MSPMAAPKSLMTISTERHRLANDRAGKENWRLWGPYLSERQWGTVREDFSAWGSAWDYLPHDHARSRAYRWGEDPVNYQGETRTAANETKALFKALDNPAIPIYIYPHVALIGDEQLVKPGFTTEFFLYKQNQFALASERY